MNDVGVVIIGRNEGERLETCLRSTLEQASAVVYVDSGSTDGSVERACDLGALVVELDTEQPFTAARARNAGFQRLLETYPDLEFVQFIDGDCELHEGWINRAQHKMLLSEDVAVVCGRRRERYPEASIYNLLCDMEWNTPIGEAKTCGGDALMRVRALHAVDGYNETLIAGEEPEMCLRMRDRGWKILRVDHDMTWHDARISQFGQWWRRATRAGYACAQGRVMYGAPPHRYRVQEIRSILVWALLVPLTAFSMAWLTWGVSLVLFSAYSLLWFRVRNHRLRCGDTPNQAVIYARYCIIGKFAEFMGMLRYLRDRVLRRQSRIIEYKDSTKAEAVIATTLSERGS